MVEETDWVTFKNITFFYFVLRDLVQYKLFDSQTKDFPSLLRRDRGKAEVIRHFWLQNWIVDSFLYVLDKSPHSLTSLLCRCVILAFCILVNVDSSLLLSLISIPVFFFVESFTSFFFFPAFLNNSMTRR